MDWDPEFIDRSPLFAPLSEHAAPLRTSREWPSRETLQRLVAARGVSVATARLHLVGPTGGEESYEARIYRDGAMQVREGEWHDLFNLLAWLAYPKTKAALNNAHQLEAREESPGQIANRSRTRDALTVLDESGAIVASSEAGLLDDLRAFRWKRLFWDCRAQVKRSMRFYVFGHALFEKALAPYVGMTAHAMLIPVSADLLEAPLRDQLAELDSQVAERVQELRTPQMLAPLPLLGVPGWWPDNEQETFYENSSYFRSGRTARRRG